MNFPLSGQRVCSSFSEHQFRLALNYRFDDPSQPASSAPSRFVDNARYFRGAWAGDLRRAGLSGVPLALSGNQQPARRRASQGDLRHRRSSIGVKLWKGAEFWANPEIDQGFRLQRHPWRRRFSERRSLQDRLVDALRAHATRFLAPNHQSRRRHREGRRRFHAVQRHALDRSAGAHRRPVRHQRHLRHQPLRQQSEVRFPELVAGQCRHLRLCRRWLGLYLRRGGGMVHRAMDLSRRRVRSVRPRPRAA